MIQIMETMCYCNVVAPWFHWIRPQESQSQLLYEFLLYRLIWRGRAVQINPLVVETEEERRIFERSESDSKKRKELRNKSVRKHTPDAEETQIIHRLWQKQVLWHGNKFNACLYGFDTNRTIDSSSALVKPNNVVWMDSTRLHTAAIMQPQYRNRHHFMIFGGFLLRSSYELAFCCCASFAHSRPRFVSLDPSTFETPVPVGSVLYLAATVVYTNPEAGDGEGTSTTQTSRGEGESATEKGSTPPSTTLVLVRVDSYVRNVEHGERKPTGTFNYSFEVDKDVKVMPRTYGEFMMYIDARRRSQTVTAMNASFTNPGVVE